jgi:hypothetical protein
MTVRHVRVGKSAWARGREQQAFKFLHQAQLRLDEENSERFYAAEIYRLFGETYLRSHRDLDRAERYLCKGLKLAHEQRATDFELKLCTSIYNLYELRPNADKYRSQLGVQIHLFNASTIGEINTAFNSLTEKQADALVISPDRARFPPAIPDVKSTLSGERLLLPTRCDR